MIPTVAIIGRPNVGKSTLFNRLAGKKLALVEDTPGVTRDWREADAAIGPLEFIALDTAGLEEPTTVGLEARMRRQTDAAIARADAIMMVIDARTGVTPLDRFFAVQLRRQAKPLLLVANKAEGQAAAVSQAEGYALGLGTPIPISAAHGEGMVDLHDALAEILEDIWPARADKDSETGAEKPFRLAVLGRPNAGKSTLINRLLGEERFITGPEPGLTRDAIRVGFDWNGRTIQIADTAGLRRKSRVETDLERLTHQDALAAMGFAEVALLVVDATQPLERQDLTIARRIIDEGRAIIIVVNKWDLVKDAPARLRHIKERVGDTLSQVRGVPIVTCSALTGKGTDRILGTAMKLRERWQIRVSTAALNRYLETALREHAPPLGPHRRRIKFRYATQAKSRPPTFIFFTNFADDIPEAYIRYLQNGLRDAFDLDGVPLRMLMKQGKNPYASKRRRQQ